MDKKYIVVRSENNDINIVDVCESWKDANEIMMADFKKSFLLDFDEEELREEEYRIYKWDYEDTNAWVHLFGAPIMTHITWRIFEV